MRIHIQIVNDKITDTTRQRFRRKVLKLERFDQKIVTALVLLRKEKYENELDHHCEIRLVIRGNDLFGENNSDNYENAIANVVESLRRRLRKKKTSRIRKRKRMDLKSVFS